MSRVLSVVLLVLATTMAGLTPAVATATTATGTTGSSTDRPRVIVIGDSLTYRGQEELPGARSSWRWTVDGLRGRNVQRLLPELREHLAATPRPDAVVIALGTNSAARWTKRHYRRAVEMLRPRTDVVLVTPYRDLAVRLAAADDEDAELRERRQARRTVAYARWMRELAAERPARRCVANWARAAERRPELLIDGIHQRPGTERPRAEQRWADLIVSAVERCAARG